MCEQSTPQYPYLDNPEQCPSCGGTELVDDGRTGEENACFCYRHCMACGRGFAVRYDYDDQYEGKEIDGELYQPRALVQRLAAEARATDLLQACKNLTGLFPEPDDPSVAPTDRCCFYWDEVRPFLQQAHTLISEIEKGIL